MGIEFTEKQSRAAGIRGKSVLVSAAAGSGKTSVLTQRIVSLILEGADIRSMLVTTYTNAAAGEMKARIARALLQHSGEKRMREQSELVSNANIGTFHSLCNRIIRENYNILGISHQFKIMSERESQKLRADSMETLFEENAGEPDFLRLLARYAKRGRMDDIAEMIGKIYRFIMSKPEPDSWLDFAAGNSFESYSSMSGGEVPGMKGEYLHTMPDVQALVQLVRRFSVIYAAVKEEKNLVDYEDLLHMALRVLDTRKYAFEYIFVDEYQDTNPVQEEIIHRLAREDNLFMVGDIKQSIYKFNLADPAIFLEKAGQFRNTEFSGELLCMNENFRSAGAVVDAVNRIMEKIMTPELGEIEYTEEEHLVCMSPEPGWCEVLLLEESGDKSIGEAEMIAEKILSIVGKPLCINGTERPLGFGDIALLMRSRSDFTEAVKKVFYSRNIPLLPDIDEKRDIPELELFVNILRLVENTQQDIPLLSVMRSFACGFDENALSGIRIAYCDGTFYSAAKRYAAEKKDPLAEKTARFFEKIEHLKLCLEALGFSDFIWTAARAFDFPTYMLCIRGGKYDAFLVLMQLCIELGENNGGSLYLAIAGLDAIKKRDGCYVKTKPEGKSDAVQLMTMHHSKGLEYPIVFLCGLHKQFNMRDLFANEKVILHSKMGILPNFVDEERCVVRATAARNAAVERLRAEYKSESLRVLYVAMTRARNALYLCGCLKDPAKSFEKWKEYADGKRAYMQSNCMLDWVMGALPEDGSIPVSVVEPEEKEMGARPLFDVEAFNKTLEEEQGEEKAFFALAQRKKIPAKLSVSEIKRKDRPAVIRMRPVVEEGAITGAKLGTLVHAVMEHIRLEDDSAAEAAERLFLREIITAEEKEAILKNAGMIDAFFGTGLAERIRQSKRVIREMPFNLLVPASEIGYAAEEPVVVQGILDLAFMEEGSWVLVDYKTDRVREEEIDEYKKIYEKQLALYEKALQEITGIPVSARYLCFLRNNLQVEA